MWRGNTSDAKSHTQKTVKFKIDFCQNRSFKENIDNETNNQMKYESKIVEKFIKSLEYMRNYNIEMWLRLS